MKANHHTIHNCHHHLCWDNSIEEALRVSPGDSIELELFDASGGQFSQESTAQSILDFDFSKVNPVTGPIHVEGAEPGDALVVEYLDFEKSGWGWTSIFPDFGLLSEDFSDAYMHISTYDDSKIHFASGIEIPVKAFTGTIGVAPAESGEHSILPPYPTGGNMDIRDLSQGTKLYLPVQVAGALLSVGDPHAAQGDGEVCGVALESPMWVKLKVDLVKGANLKMPQFEMSTSPTAHIDGKGYHVTTGVGPDLMSGARDAVRAMVDHVTANFGLESELAYCLCSVAGDLRISEIVDKPNWVVSFYLPKSIFV